MSELSTPNQLPKVTIAIPTLNRVAYLRLALESALGQTYDNLEVIVSNNASTDDTATYLSSCTDPRLRVLHQTNLLPMTENWNACLAAATGEYFLLLSDDDILEPDAIRELVAGYTEQEGHPEPGIVYGSGRIIDSAGNTTRFFKTSPSREAARDLILAFFQGNRDLWFCAVLMRTADILPGFPAAYKVACDGAVWMRAIIRRGSAVFIPKSLVRYRLHPNLSAATHFDVWCTENWQLLELLIAEDEGAGKPDPRFAKRLTSLIQQVNRGLIIGRINESYRNNKGSGLLQYGRRLPAFSSPRGLVLLAKGVVTLFLNEKTRTWLRKKLRKQSAIQ
jgi:glycosyltransferase involved in cell wall biosynthesis